MGVRGVVTADVSLEWMSKLVKAMNETQKGFCFVVTDTGAFVAYPDYNYVMKESLFSLAESHHDKRLREVAKEMLRSKKGFLDIGTSLGGQESFLAYSRILSTGWRFGAVFPKERTLCGSLQVA